MADKKRVFDPKGAAFKRPKSATEEAKRKAYEEFYGHPKPDNCPELVEALKRLRVSPTPPPSPDLEADTCDLIPESDELSLAEEGAEETPEDDTETASS